MNSKPKLALISCALIATLTAIAHSSCTFLGPVCYKAQLAPAELIVSAEQGTWLAPIATIGVSALFILCALFALSAIGVIKKLPFTSLALLSIGILCTVRGLATIPLSLIFIEMVSAFSLIAGFVWFVLGVLYLYGFIHYRKKS